MSSHKNRLTFFKTPKSQWVFAARFSAILCLFSIQYLFPISPELSLPHLSYLTLFTCSAASAAAVASLYKGKWRRVETDQAEYVASTCTLPRNASQYRGLGSAFIYLYGRWLHCNPWSFWYHDFIRGNKHRRTFVHRWVQVIHISVPSRLNTWICSWILE